MVLLWRPLPLVHMALEQRPLLMVVVQAVRTPVFMPMVALAISPISLLMGGNVVTLCNTVSTSTITAPQDRRECRGLSYRTCTFTIPALVPTTRANPPRTIIVSHMILVILEILIIILTSTRV